MLQEQGKKQEDLCWWHPWIQQNTLPNWRGTQHWSHHRHQVLPRNRWQQEGYGWVHCWNLLRRQINICSLQCLRRFLTRCPIDHGLVTPLWIVRENLILKGLQRILKIWYSLILVELLDESPQIRKWHHNHQRPLKIKSHAREPRQSVCWPHSRWQFEIRSEIRSKQILIMMFI